MDYEIEVGQVQQVVDGDGNPVDPATQPGLPYGPGLAATVTVVGGLLVCTGNFPGALPFDIYPPAGGAPVRHTVTVVAAAAAPFDWSLGADA